MALIGIHVWSLQKKLEEFLNAKNGVKFQSSEFSIGNFKWQIIAYPNGNRFENYGSVMLYLKLLSFPPNLTYGGSCIVNFRIQCLESKSSSTFIETYVRVNDSKGWSAKNLLLSDIVKESINKITFEIDVKILTIKDHNGQITYESPMKLHKNKFNLKWSVDDDTVNRMQYANNGKWFESSPFHNLWCLKCAPNGYNNKNADCCLLFLQLCALPPNISKMKCKVKLYHVESSTKWSVKKEFSYTTKNAGWTQKKLPFLKLLKYDTVTFRAQIEIMAMFDAEGNKMKINDGSTTYSATKAYDDGNIGVSSSSPFRRKSKKKKKDSKRSASTASPGTNPYGGYGSHNYQDYFNSGYKKNSQLVKDIKMEKKEEEEEKEESDSQSYDDSEGSDASSEDELQLETMDEIRDQIEFLTSEAKKLKKIVNLLNKKSKQNDKLIEILKSDINELKNGKNDHKNNDDNGLLGDLFGTPDDTTKRAKKTDTLQIQMNANVFNTGNGSEYGGWATF